MRQALRLLTATSLCGLFCLAPSVAKAVQPASTEEASPSGPASATPSTPSPGPSADAIEKARIHYERGLVLFNEDNFDAALFEFERAYELAPSYKILYNMGRIQREQKNYAAAMRSYARYLREGGAAIPAARRAEIDKELATLKPRVAEISVKVNVDGANVYADDIPVCAATIESSCVGISPLREPIVVNGGRHKITATKKGYATQTALVSVVGSDTAEVKLELVSLERPPPPKPNSWTVPAIVGWSATGLVLIGAGITGALAMNASSDQEEALKKPTATRESLSDLRDTTQTLAGVSDSLFIATGVFAGVSAYFTIKAISFDPKKQEKQEKKPVAGRFDLHFSPTGVGASGTF